MPLLDDTSKLEMALNILSCVKRFIRIKLGETKLSGKRVSRGENIQKVVSPSNEEKAEAIVYLISKEHQEFGIKRFQQSWKRKSCLRRANWNR